MDHWDYGGNSSGYNSPEKKLSSCNLCADQDGCYGAEGAENYDENSTVRKEVEVAVVGNGPAAIFLSFILSGYWPYFSGSHPDEYLTARLREGEGKSLLEQDLVELSSGLEGRSSNPIALLVDALLRPEADIGGMGHSSITWEYHAEKAIPHVVIGKGKPGGAWQYMEPTLKTLSLGSWLDLPAYSFDEWKRERMAADHQDADSDRPLDVKPNEGRERPLVGEVAHYYADFVEKMNLQQSFLDQSSVDRVMSMGKSHSEAKSSSTSYCSMTSSPPSLMSPNSPTNNISCTVPCCLSDQTECERLEDICSIWAQSDDFGIHCPLLDEMCRKRGKCSLQWYLRGKQQSCEHCGKKPRNICVFSKKLVLANGVGSNVRSLKVPGEDASFVTNDMPSFIKTIDQLSFGSENVSWPLSTVVVVGAGLSAADAILRAIGKGFKVMHIFRQNPDDKKLVFHGIPEREYPGYGKVFGLMRGKNLDDLYSRHPQSKVEGFFESSRSVTVVDREGLRHIYDDVAIAGIFIGADANLNFLPNHLISELAIKKETPVSSRNPVDVDSVNFVSPSVPSLYAIGSLTGDSFVRFGIGSAVGAAQHILGLT